MMKTVWAKAQQPITLPCDVPIPSNGNYELEWRKEGSLIFNAYGNDPGFTVAELQGRLARASNLGITFHAVNETDHATYQCVLTRFTRGAKASPEFGALLRLTVYSNPVIHNPYSGQIYFVSKNEKFSTECKASGIPPPEVVWTRVNRVFSLNSSLTFERLTQSDTGEYTCHATNFEGTAQKTVVVLLANGATMKKELANKTVVEGSSVFWHCDALGYPANITYFWFKESTPIISLELGLRSHIQEGEFGISSVSKNDMGWYTCEANNGFETSAKSKAYLDVQYKPKIKPTNKRVYIVAMNQNGTISCEVDANPPTTFIQWIKDGRPLNPTRGQQLNIFRATYSDAGIYSCQAFNSIGGSEVLEMHVIVSEPPVFSIRPPPVAYVNKGENFSMECTGFGDPPPVQYWLRKMVRYPTKILQISNISHSDYGTYRCVLTNAVATVHHDLMLFVKNTRPQCPSKSVIRCLGETGFNVTFTPGYDGSSNQHFNLHHREVDAEGRERSDWFIVDISTKTYAYVETDTPFSFHEFRLEAINKFGKTLCTLGVENVCSRPEPPTKITLDLHNVLRWESSPNAETYKISFRRTSTQPFADLAETKKTHFPLQLQILAKATDPKPNLELRIRSSRPPFPDSSSSAIFRASYGNDDYAGNNIALFCGFVLIIILGFCVFCRMHRQLKRKKQKKNKYGCANLNTAVNTFDNYSSTNANENALFSHFQQTSLPYDSEESPWTLRSTANTEAFHEEDKKPDEGDEHEFAVEEHASAVNMMLREKYMENPEYQKLNLLDQLRLEQLKQEFCSHIYNESF